MAHEAGRSAAPPGHQQGRRRRLPRRHGEGAGTGRRLDLADGRRCHPRTGCPRTAPGARQGRTLVPAAGEPGSRPGGDPRHHPSGAHSSAALSDLTHPGFGLCWRRADSRCGDLCRPADSPTAHGGLWPAAGGLFSLLRRFRIHPSSAAGRVRAAYRPPKPDTAPGRGALPAPGGRDGRRELGMAHVLPGSQPGPLVPRGRAAAWALWLGFVAVFLANCGLILLRQPSKGQRLRLLVRAFQDGWRGRLGKTIDPALYREET